MKRIRGCLKNGFSFSGEVLLGRRPHLGCPPQLQCYSNANEQSWTLLSGYAPWPEGQRPNPSLACPLGGLGQWHRPWLHSTKTVATWGDLQPQGVTDPCRVLAEIYFPSEKKKLHCAKKRITKELLTHELTILSYGRRSMNCEAF